jgi:hypothetical protein
MRGIYAFLGIVFLSGCFLEHASAAEHLRTSVTELNKSARWGHINGASAYVEPTYRTRFLETHKHWGSKIEVADAEVLQMEVAKGNDSAIAMVAYSWFSKDTMTVHSSLVRQRWLNTDNSFALISETVVDGDPRLLNVNAKADGRPTTMSDPMGPVGDASMGLSEDPTRVY